MLDRVPGNPGRVLITPEDGSAPFYATLRREDNPKQEGTPLNKETFLKDATAAKFGLSPDAVPDDVFAVLHDVIRDGNSNLHGQWMEKQVAPGISVKTGELVNLVDDLATRKMVARTAGAAVNIDDNAGTVNRYFAQIDENHVLGVYGTSLDAWVMEIGEDGSISQINEGWINASYSYSPAGVVRLNRYYYLVAFYYSNTIYMRLIYVDDAYQVSLLKTVTLYASSTYSGTTIFNFVAASETEVYLITDRGNSKYVPYFDKITLTLDGANSTISKGTGYSYPDVGTYRAAFDVYPMPNQRCLVFWYQPARSSYAETEGYCDKVVQLFDMSGGTPVLLKSHMIWDATNDTLSPAIGISTIQTSETEVLGIYAPTANDDGTNNYKIFKCVVGGDDFSVAEHDSVVTDEILKFFHYDKNKKIMYPEFPTYSAGTKYPIFYFDIDTFEICRYVSAISAFYDNVRNDSSSYPTYTIWLEDSRLMRVYYQNRSTTAYHVDAQMMAFDFTASEYLAVSDAETGEMVKLGINGNFNMPSAVAGDFYELAERVNAAAYMNGIMSFLPEPMKFATGSYYGTGYDTTNYNKVTITLDFVPKLLFVASDDGKVSAIIAPTGGVAFSPSSATEYYLYSVGATVSGTKITINAATGYLIVKQTCVSYTNTHSTLNGSGIKYNYFAFGV